MTNKEFTASEHTDNQKPQHVKKYSPVKAYQKQPENNQPNHNSRFQKPAFNKPQQRQNFNNALSDQLGRMRDNDQIDYIKRPPALMRGASSWEGDSIDHINVQSNAVTPIGRFLAQNSNFTFRHSHYGDFASVESFNVWLTTVERDDRLRTCSGNEAHYHKRKLTHRPIANLRAILLDADHQKLKQYPEALAAFKESTLPLDNYFYERLAETKFPRRSITGTWKIEGWEEIRSALKEEREPDLTRWIDVKNSGIFDFVLSDDGTKKAGPVAIERIPTPKEFRTHIYRKNPNNGSTGNNHSAIVHLNDNAKSVDLEKNPSLKNRVHVVELTAAKDTSAALAVQSVVTRSVVNKGGPLGIIDGGPDVFPAINIDKPAETTTDQYAKNAFVSIDEQANAQTAIDNKKHANDALIEKLEKHKSTVGQNGLLQGTVVIDGKQEIHLADIINEKLEESVKNESRFIKETNGAASESLVHFSTVHDQAPVVVPVTEHSFAVHDACTSITKPGTLVPSAGSTDDSVITSSKAFVPFLEASTDPGRGNTEHIVHIDGALTDFRDTEQLVDTSDISKAIEKTVDENNETANTSVGAALMAAMTNKQA